MPKMPLEAPRPILPAGFYQCCGSGMFSLDPGSRIRLFSIPDPGSELSPSRIPDPGSRGQKHPIPDPGSQIRIRNTGFYIKKLVAYVNNFKRTKSFGIQTLTKLPELTVLSWLTCVVNNNSPQEGFVRVSPQKSVRKSSLKLLCTGGNRPQDVSLVLAENPAVFEH